jgi:hypothetical protein
MNMSNHEGFSTPFMGYYVRFGLILLALYVLVAVISVAFSLENMSGVTFVAPFLTAQFVSDAFIKKLRRVPTDAEITRLTQGCILVTILVNIPLALISVLAGALGQGFSFMVMIVAGVLLVLMLVLNYFLMRWTFDGLAKRRAKKLGVDLPENES